MTEQAKAKLPKVWVMFRDGVAWEVRYYRPKHLRVVCEDFEQIFHQYAPVQPPRRCVWTENEEGQWDTQCGGMFEFTEGGPEDNEQAFCGYCGGKLKAEHYDNSGGTWEECVHGRKS